MPIGSVLKAPAMDFRRKIYLSVRFTWYVIRLLLRDLWAYYASAYPLLLLGGAWRRILRRVTSVWCKRSPGRPPVSEELVDLVLDMKRANWGWGALRISQELALLGIALHKKTVQRLLKENGLMPPSTKFPPPTWRSLFVPYAAGWSLDFTSWFDKDGVQLFILVVIDLCTRELVSINATASPDRHWITQQISNAAISGFALPTRLLTDNDGLFGHWLVRDFKKLFDIEVSAIPPGAPWLNGICERFHRSLKHEILRRVGDHDVATVRAWCVAYQDYYNKRRPHQGLGGRTPGNCASERPISKQPFTARYRACQELAGLVTRFEFVA